MNGWIKLHRRLLEWEWYDDANVKVLFLHLLLMASTEDKRWHGISIQRGSLVVGRQELANQLNMSVQSVRTAIEKLKTTGEVTTESTNKYTIITISKYDSYQCAESPNQPADQPTTNQRATNNQPTNNQQTTTSKEYKNIRNKEDNNKKENIKEKRFSKPTLQEVIEYCIERNNSVDPERFIDFYESKGWKIGSNPMKDWKAAVRTWEKRNTQHGTEQIIDIDINGNATGYHQTFRRDTFGADAGDRRAERDALRAMCAGVLRNSASEKH